MTCNRCRILMHITHFLYGLQAAMNLRSLETGWPFILRSHMISLISPTLSVVFASSKKTTVLRLGLTSLLICANLSASFTKFVTCLLVTPPCIYTRTAENFHLTIKINDYIHLTSQIDTYTLYTFRISMFLCSKPPRARSHM